MNEIIEKELSFPEAMTFLNEKEQLFVSEYLVDFNASRAAEAAGWTKSSARTIGWRLLRRVDVTRAITAARKLLARDINITKEDIVFKLQQIAEKAINGDGAFPDRMAAIKAWELIAKMLGYIEDKSARLDTAASGRKFIVNIYAPGMMPKPAGQIIEGTTVGSNGVGGSGLKLPSISYQPKVENGTN